MMGAGMTAKQKGMIGAMIIIVLVVIWQVMGLVGSGSSAKPVSAGSTASKNGTANKMTSTMPTSALTAGNNPTLQPNELRQAAVASDTRFLQLQQMSEQKYIGKLNDLEDLKIQREIAETNQAIATAKLATVTAEKNISDLLTRTAPEASAYANKLAQLGTNGANVNANEAPASPVPVALDVGYSIISVSMQLHKWSAIIGYQGKLFNVVVGDVLAPDGSVVVNINKNSVILKKNDTIRKISITSSL